MGSKVARSAGGGWTASKQHAFEPGDVVAVNATVRRANGKRYYELDEPLLVLTPTQPGSPLYESVRFCVPVDRPPFHDNQRVSVRLSIQSLTNDPMSRIDRQDEETTVHVRLAEKGKRASKGELVDVFPPHLAPSLFRRMSGNRNARWFHHDDFFSYHFSKDELCTLLAWSGTTDPREAPSLLNALVRERLDASARGERARGALKGLGFLNPFSQALLRVLPEQYGVDALSGVHFHYNGHMTRAMFPLFSVLKVLGLAGGSATRSGYSGTYPMEGIMDAQLEGRKLRPHELRSKRNAETIGLKKGKGVGPAGTESSTEWMRRCALGAVRRGQIFVADKASTLLTGEPPPEELLDAMRTGKIRFIIHNSDDRRALLPYLKDIWAVDVAGSMLKELEATIIGEQYALLAAREARNAWGAPIRDVLRMVIGFGLLGAAVAEAMARFSAAEGRDSAQVRAHRKSVIVVDTDKAARERARRLGFTAMSPDEAPRDGRAVAVVATPGAGVDAKARLPKETLILGLTSAGKGVDLASLRERAEETGGSVEIVRKRSGGFGVDHFEPLEFDDLKMSFPAEDGERSVTIVNGGYPLNLFEESWSDRFTVTAAAVILGVLKAAKLEGPGLTSITDDDSIPIRVLFESAGLLRPYPIDTDDPAQLAGVAEDMEAYRAAQLRTGAVQLRTGAGQRRTKRGGSVGRSGG